MPILQMRRRAQEGNSGTKTGFTPPASSDSPETDIQTLPLLYSCPGVFVNLVTLPLREETGSERGKDSLESQPCAGIGDTAVAERPSSCPVKLPAHPISLLLVSLRLHVLFTPAQAPSHSLLQLPPWPPVLAAPVHL